VLFVSCWWERSGAWVEKSFADTPIRFPWGEAPSDASTVGRGSVRRRGLPGRLATTGEPKGNAAVGNFVSCPRNTRYFTVPRVETLG